MKIPQNVINYLEKQGFVIISTLDDRGAIHSVAKGLVAIDPEGIVHIVDLFKGNTFKNLMNNPTISLTSVDEHAYVGYTLKGQGRITEKEKISKELLGVWEEKVLQRITKRMIRNIQQEKKSSHHHEAHFQKPEYLITMTVEEIVDLNPTH